MPASPGFTSITASSIHDASGRLLASGFVNFFPVNNLGQPVSAIAGGGGPVTQTLVTFPVVNGAISNDLYGNPAQVADCSLTTPQWIGYIVTVLDASGAAVQGPGYGFVQPWGPTWSLDTWSSSITPLPTLPGNLIKDGVTGTFYFFSINLGQLALFPAATGTGTPTSIVFADTDGSGIHYAMTFNNGARQLTNIGSLGTAVAGITFADQQNSNFYTLQVYEGGFEEVQVSSIASAVASYTLADCKTGALKVLSFIGGAFSF